MSDPLLRIVQRAKSAGLYQAEIEFINGTSRMQGTASVRFAPTEAEQEAIRWYFEDFLTLPLNPAPRIAQQIERRLDEIGLSLFADTFQSNEAVREIWVRAQHSRPLVHFEIACAAEETILVPWELMREQAGTSPLSISVQSFVRTIDNASQGNEAI